MSSPVDHLCAHTFKNECVRFAQQGGGTPNLGVVRAFALLRDLSESDASCWSHIDTEEMMFSVQILLLVGGVYDHPMSRVRKTAHGFRVLLLKEVVLLSERQ